VQYLFANRFQISREEFIVYKIPWVKIVDEGIAFRSSPQFAESWEYSIPGLSQTWHGPYRTREAARQSALEDLLQQAQIHVNVSNEPRFSLNVNQALSNSQEHFAELQHQLEELQMMRAALGVESADYIDPLIEQAKTALNSIR
jgi:hypothetical protein